jgi:phage tail-like protein
MPPSTKLISDHHFKLSVPGLAIGTFKTCTGLMMQFEVFEWPEGGNNEFVHHLPGRVTYPLLTLEAGLTEDDAIQKWFWQTRTKAELKEITIELQSQDGKSRRAWTFADAWPVRWSGPVIAAASTNMGEEFLEIAHSGLKMA